MKAIPTLFDGRQYRSRLEARWAVFLTTLGVRFDYEPEGFTFDCADRPILYLPDFWLPDIGAWLEVKRELRPNGSPDPDTERKAGLLAIGSGYPVYVFGGEIDFLPDPYYEGLAKRAPEAAFCSPWEDPEAPGAAWDYGYMWCECPGCGMVGIEFNGCADRLPCVENGCPGDGSDRSCGRGHNPASRRLIDAYAAAMRAQFEHGARGRHGFAAGPDVFCRIASGPRIGRAIRRGQAMLDAEPRPEGGEVA